MYRKLLTLMLSGVILLAACSPAVDVPTTQEIATAVGDALSPEAAQNIQNQISQLLTVPVESLQLEQVQKMEWPDGCLGLGQAGEVCTQAVTPGWLLTFKINGQEYRFRANESGTLVRQEQ